MSCQPLHVEHFSKFDGTIGPHFPLPNLHKLRSMKLHTLNMYISLNNLKNLVLHVSPSQSLQSSNYVFPNHSSWLYKLLTPIAITSFPCGIIGIPLDMWWPFNYCKGQSCQTLTHLVPFTIWIPLETCGTT